MIQRPPQAVHDGYLISDVYYKTIIFKGQFGNSTNIGEHRHLKLKKQSLYKFDELSERE